MRAIFFLLILIFTHLVVKSNAQTNDFACEQAAIMLNTLKEMHYSPLTLDDDFSKKWYVQFIHQLDAHGLYFSQTDLDSLKEYKFALDDEIKSQDCQFLTQITSLYTDRLEKSHTKA